MIFHPEKCTTIRITNKGNPLNTNYSVHGHTLDVVKNGKHMGLTITHDLQWRTHINQTVSKASRTLGFLRRNLGRCKPEVKANTYCTMVRPSLEYASTVWNHYQNNLDKDLEQVQRRAARLIFISYQDELQDASPLFWIDSNANYFNTDGPRTDKTWPTRS